MTSAFGLLIATILVADYLMLSVSHVVLGVKANWILLLGIVQIVALVLALFLGRGRGLRPCLPMLGFLGLGIIMLAHLGSRAVAGGQDSYGTLKTFTYFMVSGPAFLLGCILGRSPSLPGTKWCPLLIAPLFLMCGLAILTDKDAMTIDRVDDLEVYLGVLVLPVHQALAFSLGKIALWLHTTIQKDAHMARVLPTLGLIAACFGLSLLSGSRGYVIAALAAFVVQWCVGRKHFVLLALVAWIPAAFYVAFSSGEIRRGLDPKVIASSTSMHERSDLWEAAAQAFWARPAFGHGPGGFAAFQSWEERVYPHNIALEILSEFGIVGAACCLMILIPLVINVVKVASRRERLTDTQFFALGFLVFSLVGAMGVADLIRNHFLFLAAGMTAIAFAPDSARARRRNLAPTPATAT